MNRKLILVAYFCNALLFPIKAQLLLSNEKSKMQYFPLREPTKVKHMQANWDMYFNQNVATELDPSIKDNWFELKLDSYGNLYPDSEVLAWFTKKEFNGHHADYAASDIHSFHYMFNPLVSLKLDSCLETLPPSNKTIYAELIKTRKEELKVLQGKLKGKVKSKNIDSLEQAFYTQWETYHFKKVNNLLQEKIKAKNINRVQFFIHGYNVPYSLAALQAVSICKLAKAKLGKDSSTTLFIPIYWPSNNAKDCQLDSLNFSTLNFIDFNRNGKLFLIYGTRCYYAAMTLRKFINALDTVSIKRIDIIGHSLGTMVASSALINTFSKIDYRKKKLYKLRNESIPKLERYSNLKRKDPISYNLLMEFKKIPLPYQRKIHCFLSAAAMPGINTFNDMDSMALKHTSFFVTVNQNDEMLTKRIIQEKIGTKLVNASNMNATSLGCNYKCEAGNTEKLVNTKMKNVPNKTNSFIYETVSREYDHDVFTYLQQGEYLSLFAEFLK